MSRSNCPSTSSDLGSTPPGAAGPTQWLGGLDVTRAILARIAENSVWRADRAARRTLIARLAEAGALPLIYRYFGDQGIALPGSAHRYWRVHRARLALCRAELGRVLDRLRPIGPAIVLKGEPLAQLFYGDGTLRSTSDLDVLMDWRRLDDAVDALAELGYRPADERDSVKPWAYNQLALVHDRHQAIVELHWRIAFPNLPSPPIAELVDETVEVALGDTPVQTLRPELLLLQLAYHFHQHRGFLKGLLDIAAWIDRFEASADLAEIFGRADRLGIGGVVQWPLHVLARWTGHRTRLYDPDVDPCVRAWAAWTAAQTERAFVDLDPPGAVQAWLNRSSTAATAASTLVTGLTMAVVDGAHHKVSAGVRSVLFGPHRVGRAMMAGLEASGLASRDELFDARLFADFGV